MRIAQIAHGLGVTRVLADQARIVVERFFVAGIGPELAPHALGRAVDVFRGPDLGHRAFPVRAGADAKQVVRGLTIRVSNFLFAPATFKGRLGHHEGGGNTAFGLRLARGLGMLGQKSPWAAQACTIGPWAHATGRWAGQGPGPYCKRAWNRVCNRPPRRCQITGRIR